MTKGPTKQKKDAAVGPSTEDRRRVLKAGALLVPTIMTLHAAPAWAQTDYTLVAYMYGEGAGLCKNPKWKPDSPGQGQEKYIECPNP